MDFEGEMLALLPALRRFALSLTRRHVDADDLVQDAVLRMWRARGRFEPGTNLRAWAFTILRNRFYSAFIPRYSTVASGEIEFEALSEPAMQERRVAGRDIRRALQALHPRLREVLALTAEAELEYQEAAAIIGCPVGTVKSRAFRARAELQRLLRHQEEVPNDEVMRQSSSTISPALRHVLIIEDVYDLAMEMKNVIQSRNRILVTACATKNDGLKISAQLRRIDVAILDVELPDGDVFPLVDPLISRGTKVAFASGHGKERIPDRYKFLPHFAKPVPSKIIVNFCRP